MPTLVELKRGRGNVFAASLTAYIKLSEKQLFKLLAGEDVDLSIFESSGRLFNLELHLAKSTANDTTSV